jgi:hypothetical protein
MDVRATLQSKLTGSEPCFAPPDLASYDFFYDLIYGVLF